MDKLEVYHFSHIILLCYSDTLAAQEADSKTLITLLHLRDISEKLNKPLTIVSEMMDIKNRNLAEIAKVNDFIVSDKLISLMISQVSENKSLNAVFADLFDPDGSEIYLKPAKNYVKTDGKVNFYTIIESARKQNETAIGYKLSKHVNNASMSYGVIINPDKSEFIEFTQDDKIIVLAEI